MRGLLLVDRDNADVLGPYLANFIKPLSKELVIGILTRSGLSAEIPDIFRTFQRTVVVIFYCGNLGLDVAQYCRDLTQYKMMLLSSNPVWLKEAKDLHWDVCPVAKNVGELYQPHVDRFTQMIRPSLDVRNEATKPTFVLSLDLDETVVFYESSKEQNKVLLNPVIKKFVEDFFCDYGAVANIKLVVVTARNEEVEIRVAASNPGHISVERVLIMLVGHLNGLVRRADIAVHYTQEKHEKLVELYGKDSNTYVLHLDDNRDWTDPFDEPDQAHPRITYAWVQSPIAPAWYPKTPFFPNENELRAWCFGFAQTPGAVQTNRVYGTFSSLFSQTRGPCAVTSTESSRDATADPQVTRCPSFCAVS